MPVCFPYEGVRGGGQDETVFGRAKTDVCVPWLQVIHKQHPSSFTGTDLQAHLEKVGKKKIVLAGMLALAVLLSML